MQTGQLPRLLLRLNVRWDALVSRTGLGARDARLGTRSLLRRPRRRWSRRARLSLPPPPPTCAHSVAVVPTRGAVCWCRHRFGRTGLATKEVASDGWHKSPVAAAGGLRFAFFSRWMTRGVITPSTWLQTYFSRSSQARFVGKAWLAPSLRAFGPLGRDASAPRWRRVSCRFNVWAGGLLTGAAHSSWRTDYARLTGPTVLKAELMRAASLLHRLDPRRLEWCVQELKLNATRSHITEPCAPKRYGPVV